jgi:hypothetical protein
MSHFSFARNRSHERRLHRLRRLLSRRYPAEAAFDHRLASEKALSAKRYCRRTRDDWRRQLALGWE